MNKIHVSDLILYEKSANFILEFLEKNKIKNLEFFIEPLDKEYTQKMLKVLDNYCFESISFHGPFRRCNLADLSKQSWEDTLYSYKKSFEIAQKYKPKFMVLHSNEGIPSRIIDEHLKDEIQKKIYYLINLGKEYGIDVVIENVGIKENMVFSQGEYEEIILKNNYKSLIDIGHAHLNEWKIEELISKLKNNILGFHFHNNDSIYDTHNTLYCGNIDYDNIIDCIKFNAPNAVIVLEYDFSRDLNILLEDIKKLEDRLYY